MAWQKPKTDWDATDYFNLVDYARITGNIVSLTDLANKTVGGIEIVKMDAKPNYTDIPYARNINDIENNVETINLGTYNIDIGTKQTFSDNDYFITYDELNRLESAILLLYRTVVAQNSIARHLAFTLNGAKPFGARVHYATDETIAHRFEFNLGQPNGGIRV